MPAATAPRSIKCLRGRAGSFGAAIRKKSRHFWADCSASDRSRHPHYTRLMIDLSTLAGLLEHFAVPVRQIRCAPGQSALLVADVAQSLAGRGVRYAVTGAIGALVVSGSML